jgi:protein-S-isoprenylcysteine O-methyltransferase Ste14
MNRKASLAMIAEFAVLAALLFVPAGMVLWPAAWAFMAIFFGFQLALVLMLVRENPALLAERMSSPMQRGQPLWDKAIVAAFLLLGVAWLILMPLDAVRFGWSDVPGWLQILGALGLALSLYVVLLTFMENAYLAPVVKLQQDRGQSVVTTGPYRYVRHPMYSGMLVFFPAITLLLGSWWGLLLSSALIGLFVLRTIFEDRMLRNELAGYPEYARNVKYRLIPRVW